MVIVSPRSSFFPARCTNWHQCVICAACLGNVTIIPKSKEGSEGAGKGAKITHGSYLLAVLRGKLDKPDNASLELQGFDF